MSGRRMIDNKPGAKRMIQPIAYRKLILDRLAKPKTNTMNKALIIVKLALWTYKFLMWVI
jgi:hypothetical protein